MEKSENKIISKKSKLSTPILYVMIAVASGFFGGYFGSQVNVLEGSENTTKVQREIIEGEGNLINTIAKDVSPSVVSINVTSTAISQDFFGIGREFEQESAGTGVIISEDGLIITNRHVVPSGTNKVNIVLTDGTELEAEVVGRTNGSDPLDIAFLKIKDLNGKDIIPAKIGDSDKVEVGDRVVAIGNALGQFQNTVTSGIISGFGRDIEAYDGGGVETLQNLFQTDAAINGGNSGGPLVNSASEVIGINVATATADNISFAIPINDVKPLIDIVLETGKLERPYLGVRYVPLNEEVSRELDLSLTQGSYIPKSSGLNPSIIPDSPAEKAGLAEEDIIIEINGKKLDEDNTVVSILGRLRVGSLVDIKVDRAGQEVLLQAVLEAAPEQ
ncbi:MAG: trypsin-like peptidase domain-containing protein [Candidatus Saccharibacteria bacterium]|nr:trypsin-like peptidase domain-containing protein [Candidatus Saccharibacteria bacterium]